MGNLSQNSLIYHSSFNLAQWNKIESEKCIYRQSHGKYTSYENKISHQQIDKYELEFRSKKEQQNYYQCYLQRYREEYIVNTVEFMNKNISQLCSNIYHSEVYIQHIPIRLGDVTDIPYPDNLYILRNALVGFSLLYQMIGYFQVEEDHFCINNYGELKVWLNCDLSKNYPEDFEENYKSQCDMVNKIINIVQKNTNIQQCPIEITEYFNKKHKKNCKFSQTIHLIDQYIKQYKTIMPKYCQSILQIFKEGNKTIGGHSLSKQQKQNQNTIKHSVNNSINHILSDSNANPHLNYSNANSNTNKSLQINGITIPKLPIGEHQKSIEVSISQRDTVKIQSPSIDMGYADNQLKKTRLLNQTTQRVPATHRNSVLCQPHRVLMNNFNKLQTKRTPIKQFKFYNSVANKPKVNFTYRSPAPQIRDTFSLAAQTLQNSIRPLKIQEEKHDKQNQTRVKSRIQLCYYDTGTGSEEIDPEIAADLIKYL